ncbi:MAG: hypothetical protein R3275_06465 [Saprospiraceae bacterium]|nr:hypothetical protein [Saprospiraceae bacterium]
MKLFAADFDVVILRYFLTMFLAIGAFMSGLPWLAVLCLPTFLLAILAVRFTYREDKRRAASLKPYQNPHIEEAA